VRKIHLVLSILGLLAVACDTTTLIPATPTFLVPASMPAETLPPTPLPTETLAYTSTPTSLATATAPTPIAAAGTPAASDTSTPVTGTISPASTLEATSTLPTPSPTPQGPVFEIVNLSSPQLQWGDTCDNKPVTVTAQVATGFNVTSVLLFTRLQSQNGNITTAWNKALSMHDDGLGTFTYDLSTKVIKYYQAYNIAWVQYQLVATNVQQQEVGRTQVYLNNLTIARCP